MGAIVVLVLATGGESGSLLDRVLPETAIIRIRMLTIREGMSQEEVSRRLGLKDRIPSFSRFTISHHDSTYPIGETHSLTVGYSLKDGPGLTYGLSEITLKRNRAK